MNFEPAKVTIDLAEYEFLKEIAESTVDNPSKTEIFKAGIGYFLNSLVGRSSLFINNSDLQSHMDLLNNDPSSKYKYEFLIDEANQRLIFDVTLKK
jgi:hypothetical protein